MSIVVLIISTSAWYLIGCICKPPRKKDIINLNHHTPYWRCCGLLCPCGSWGRGIARISCGVPWVAENCAIRGLLQGCFVLLRNDSKVNQCRKMDLNVQAQKLRRDFKIFQDIPDLTNSCGAWSYPRINPIKQRGEITLRRRAKHRMWFVALAAGGWKTHEQLRL